MVAFLTLARFTHKPNNRSWPDFRRQNELVLQALQQSGVEHEILDAYHLLVRRPDFHHPNDCFHYYRPGPTDTINELMLHYLRKDRTVQHADQLDSQVYYSEYWSVKVAD